MGPDDQYITKLETHPTFQRLGYVFEEVTDARVRAPSQQWPIDLHQASDRSQLIGAQ